MPRRPHRGDGTVVAGTGILERAPGYRLSPRAAGLLGGERPWTSRLECDDTDARILALEYHEPGEGVRTGARPEVDGKEDRADVALNDAPFEAGRPGRLVTLAEVIDGTADAYQREIDAEIGPLTPTTGR